ncbi:FtsB family cell division protein [Chthonobacter rhizosphaerae]|uniref:FtsB family cell division protein n=1 Tax=Chthonobacter rhizosphaerae TaxID=2735553 RepID=UPI0015EEDED4|nr:septum formation initiator family protein [Chthonobacter rhizosphaerae]
MATRQYRPSKLRRLVLPSVTALFLGYFAYHAFHGEYGLVGRARLESRAEQLSGELARLKAQRATLETEVGLLRPGSLDQDMVDERARDSLAMVHPNDVVIMRGARPTSAATPPYPDAGQALDGTDPAAAMAIGQALPPGQ